MSTSIVPSGVEIAAPLPHSSEPIGHKAPEIHFLQDLVQNLHDDPSASMLRSTAKKFAEYQGKSTDEVSLEFLASHRTEFREFLRERKYPKNSVHSYSHYLNVLVTRAREMGWEPEVPLMSPSWGPVVAAMTRETSKVLIRHLSRNGHVPSTVKESDLLEWATNRVKKGLSYGSAHSSTYELRRFLIEGGLNAQLSSRKVAKPKYGIRLDQMSDQLRSEIEEILRWKQDAFMPGRPAKAHVRGITAKNLENGFRRVIGFCVNILGNNNIASLSEVITEPIVAAFVNWALKTRRLKNGTVSVDLARISAALGQHPKYSVISNTWLPALLRCIPPDSEEDVRRRKEEKYLSYEVLREIPGAIRKKRAAGSEGDPWATARSVRDELMLEWMLTLPWRQRNHRECRVAGDNPNLFKARVPPLAGLSKPEWLQEMEKEDPEVEVWQIHFAKDETKTHHEVSCVLPRRLAGLVEEYVSKHRAHLIKSNDPGTLFLNDAGGSYTIGTFINLVSGLTLRYGGRRVTPHLFRDIFAFMWLKKMPEDYLTLSKLLWHRNIQTTIRKYGWMCNESSALCRMEQMLDQ